MNRTQSYLIRKFKQPDINGITFIKTYKASDGHYIWDDNAIHKYDKSKKVCRIQLSDDFNKYGNKYGNVYKKMLQISIDKPCEFDLPWTEIGRTYLTFNELKQPKYTQIFELIFVQLLQIVSNHKSIKYNNNVLFEKDSQYNMLIECDLEVV